MKKNATIAGSAAALLAALAAWVTYANARQQYRDDKIEQNHKAITSNKIEIERTKVLLERIDTRQQHMDRKLDQLLQRARP